MEDFNRILENKKNKFSIIIMSDLHVGSVNFDEKACKHSVKYVVQLKENGTKVVVILLGDLVECINHHDPRFSPVEIAEKYKIKDLKDLPRKQMQHAAKILKPIENDIKYCLIGNHEEMYVKYNGFDVYDYFCTDLMPDCTKLGFMAIGNILCRNATSSKVLRFALTHGTGGGGFREGYAMNNCVDIFRKFRCDFHIMGHTHRLESKPYERETTDQKGKHKKIYIYYAVAGCFLQTYVVGHKNYYEGKKGDASDVGFIEIPVWNSHGDWHYNLLKHKWMNDRFMLI